MAYFGPFRTKVSPNFFLEIYRFMLYQNFDEREERLIEKARIYPYQNDLISS